MTAPLPNLQQRFEAVLTPALAVDGLRQQSGCHGEGDAALEVWAEADDIALRLKLMNLTHAAVNQCLYGTAGPMPEREDVQVVTQISIRSRKVG